MFLVDAITTFIWFVNDVNSNLFKKETISFTSVSQESTSYIHRAGNIVSVTIPALNPQSIAGWGYVTICNAIPEGFRPSATVRFPCPYQADAIATNDSILLCVSIDGTISLNNQGNSAQTTLTSLKTVLTYTID